MPAAGCEYSFVVFCYKLLRSDMYKWGEHLRQHCCLLYHYLCIRDTALECRAAAQLCEYEYHNELLTCQWLICHTLYSTQRKLTPHP